jgi:hypothetical protein
MNFLNSNGALAFETYGISTLHSQGPRGHIAIDCPVTTPNQLPVVRSPGVDETRLSSACFLGNVCRMSAVELAVKKVKKLSARQARELLGWLDERQTNGKSSTRPGPKSRQSALARRKQKFKEWHDSVRGTTDWEPPRMPDDLVKPFRL